LIKKQVYLDHNATTPLKNAAREAMLEVLSEPGNASSVHKAGRAARQKIEIARREIAAFVNAGDKSSVVFTSGATEANNMVLKGAGVERILVSAIEHPSVLEAAGTREIIPILPSGLIDIGALDRLLEGNIKTTLISVMLVNNETGVIQPVEAVMEVARRRGALVHADAVQAAGRIPVDAQKLGVDFLTLSSHKIGGPQGAGALVISNCASVSPLMTGGGQEKNLRAGTENVAAIAGFGKAAVSALQDMSAYQSLAALRDRAESALASIAPSLLFFGREAPRVANTSMFSLPGVPSETQLIALDIAGVCVSNGSACASGTVKTSHVLKAMGVDEQVAACALRISLGWNSNADDVECFIGAWAEMFNRVKART